MTVLTKDKTSKERDKLQAQITKLTDTVEEQWEIIEDLRRENKTLKEQNVGLQATLWTKCGRQE